MPGDGPDEEARWQGTTVVAVLAYYGARRDRLEVLSVLSTKADMVKPTEHKPVCALMHCTWPTRTKTTSWMSTSTVWTGKLLIDFEYTARAKAGTADMSC